MTRGNISRARINFKIVLILGFFALLMVFLVSAVSWKGDMEKEYFGGEDTLPLSFYYNFSNETEELEEGMVFYILSEDNIKSSNPLHTEFSISNFYWIYWNDTTTKSDSSNGILVIDSTNDNETGRFNMTIGVQKENNETQIIKPLEFTINATNDAPEFTDILNYYNFSLGNETIYFLNATDEENHFPLIFNISFNETNCTHGVNTGLNDSENCILLDEFFNMSFNSSFTNTSAKISFTPNSSHIGIYWANVSVRDSGENYNCSAYPHCEPDYSNNQTIYYSQIVKFEILYDLLIDVSDCNNKTFNDTSNFSCWINISTKGETDLLNINNTVFLDDFTTPSYVNQSWFFANFLANSSNFNYAFLINVTPGKKEVGNWSINFSVSDQNSNQKSEIIYIYVNKTSENTIPQMTSILSQNVSIDSNNTFYFNITDDDSLVPDKRIYNESFVLSYIVLNASNNSQILSNFSDFTISYYSNGLIEGTNVTKMKIDFFPNSSEDGDFTINLTATDNSSAVVFTLFNLTVLNNTPPYWNTINSFINLSTSNIPATEGFNFTLNLTQENNYFWANDSDEEDVLTFSNSSDIPPRFNLTEEGIINFTPWKQDIGFWTFDIIVSDGYLSNTTQVVFNISNNNSAPSISSLTGDYITPNITLGSSANVTEDNLVILYLQIEDNDFLISSGYYNETLSVNTLLLNLSSVDEIPSINFTFGSILSPPSNLSVHLANFTPTKSNVGVYNVTINVTDAGELPDLFYFNLTILEINHAPQLDFIDNQSLIINETFNLNINANDTEDIDDSYGNLTYSLDFISGENFTEGNELIFNTTSGVFNFTFNESYLGIYEINISVNDSDGMVDSQIFKISIYGFAELITPSQNSTFNFTEAVEGNFTLGFNHSVGDNLDYTFFIDNITCNYQNSSNCSYSNLSYRENTTSYGNETSFNYSWTPSYKEETYGNLKNLTIKVYPATDDLNDSQKESIAKNFTYKLNISHTNSPIEFVCDYIESRSTTWTQSIDYNLSSCFSDLDEADNYYQQNINLSIVSETSPSYIRVNEVSIPANFSYNNWGISFSPVSQENETNETITIFAFDMNNTSNETITSAQSNQFQVEFTEPTTTQTQVPSSGSSSGSTTLLKLFSIRIIIPQDIIISNQNFIEIPFTLQNTGEVDLKGINLTSLVLFNTLYSEDIKIFMEPIYFPELKMGESQNLTMKILADTQKEGRYKATVYANVASPKFSDWGDFFIELRKVSDTEAEKIILFTEKLISENPECLELIELLKNAKDKLSKGESEEAINIATDISSACEEAIKSNEQIRFKLKDSLNKNFYYLLFAVLSVLLMGFIIYIYKRIRFNK